MSETKKSEIVEECRDKNLFLFGGQETKHVEECVIEQGKYLLILPKNNSKHHGLGFVIKKEVKFFYQKIDY